MSAIMWNRRAPMADLLIPGSKQRRCIEELFSLAAQHAWFDLPRRFLLELQFQADVFIRPDTDMILVISRALISLEG
jgi:hypothetical protein